ncbi:MAG: hypothetical protein IJU66_09605 [Oscillospiraceae bacterium]|nr:hypothetical protein [Oscillospiraceae bacterium]
MNKLRRSLSIAERVLLAILGLLVIGVAYYYLVYLAVAEDMAAARARKEDLGVQLLTVQSHATQLRKMKKELDALDDNKDHPRMESYNNSREEIKLLNNILRPSKEYTINFSSVSRAGDQIRRSFSLNFTTDSYDVAERIVIALTESRCRCLVDDVSCTPSVNGEVETVSIALVATFYETLVGGTPDAGLPADGETVG